MRNNPTILVVEDEKFIGDFLKAMLTAKGYRVLPAARGEEAISLASSHCPCLILLDLGLPDMDGLEVMSNIRQWSAVPIIVVSARRQEGDIVQALDHGADDYIIKPFNNSILMARVRTALRRSTAPGSGVKMRQTFNGGSLCIDYDKRLVTVKGQVVHLTPVEYKVLGLLAQDAGRVLTNDTLRRELWGPHATDNRILRVNMANLRRKIEINSADPQYILTEVGIGYRMMEADDPQEY